MKRGSIAILIILLVAIGAAAVSVWYHYANQRLVQEFWGTGAAMLITQAPQVTAMQLGEPGAALPSEEDPEPPADAPPADEPAGGVIAAPQVAFEFNEVPWLVVVSNDAARAKGIGNLRRALVLDSTYDWSTQPAAEPKWQYALDMSNDRDFAAVLFDFDTRQVGLAGGRRTLVMNEAAAAEFKKFFEEQLGEKAQPKAEAEPVAAEQPSEAAEAESEASSEPPPSP